MAHENAAVRVASQLRSEILEGDIAAGSRLSQQSIAERFGVSRIPVRDALQILAAEGLVASHLERDRRRDRDVSRRIAGTL